MDELIQRKNKHKSGSIKYFKSKEFCDKVRLKLKKLEEKELEWLNDK